MKSRRRTKRWYVIRETSAPCKLRNVLPVSHLSSFLRLSNGIPIAMLDQKKRQRNSKRYVILSIRRRHHIYVGSVLISDFLFQISEAFEVLSDKQKRTIYDQFGEEGLKGRGSASGAGASGGGFSGFSGFPGGSFNSGGFPGGTTFTFTSGGPGGSFSNGGFSPSDPNKIFE